MELNLSQCQWFYLIEVLIFEAPVEEEQEEEEEKEREEEEEDSCDGCDNHSVKPEMQVFLCK